MNLRIRKLECEASNLSIFDGRTFVCLVYPVIAAVGAGLGYPEYRREVGEGGDGGVEQFILLLHTEHIRYPYQEIKKCFLILKF